MSERGVMTHSFFTLIFWVLATDLSPGCGAPHPTPASVFLPKSAAETVLTRQKRFNSGMFEELRWGNLERECMEERCDLEEAREVFENEEKTMEFWVGYVDGDQCQSAPCQNGGQCKDDLNMYICTCSTGFTGNNCEIETERQCDINNGGCMHFCEMDPVGGAECSCATGYRLAQDSMACKPEGEFPCGKLGKAVTSLHRSLQAVDLAFASLNTTAWPLNMTVNATTLPSTTAPTTAPTTASTTAPTLRRSRSKLPKWVFSPTMAFVLPEKNQHKRIVGGNNVIKGELPWQVALINKATQQIFCGGSILNERWIITAAHCLVEGREGSYLVRVGEHNINWKEGTEQDHKVTEQHPFPLYNPRVNQYNHDVALLKLQTPIRFNDYVRPICLGPHTFAEEVLKAGDMATVSGWGRMRFQGAEASILQKVEVPYVDRTECKDSSSDRISRYMFCAGYYDVEKDACQGDSGGPHANRYHDTWFLTGIVSWGEECAMEGKYGVYTHVSQYYAWIFKVTAIKRQARMDDLDLLTPYT